MVKERVYVVCPLCARNRPLETKTKGLIEFGYWDENSLLIQIRSASGGKIKESGKTGRGKAPGIGFPLIKKKSLTLEEAIKQNKYKPIINNIKNQLLLINKIFINNKLIKKSELKF